MPNSRSRDDNRFDVIILGSGIAGSTLGAILARHGASVLIVDAGTHPRFAVGESTTPYTIKLFRQLALRYDVPELECLSYDQSVASIGTSFGIKRHFGFMLHREGEEPDPRQTNQFGAAEAVHTSHLFRQDSDSFLFHTAIAYGCQVRQGLRVAKVELGDDEVELVGQDGDRFHGRYLVDGSGFRSPVAEQLGLREKPEALKHHSRSLFSHMIDVRRTDDCLDMAADDRPPWPWVEGTMHHIFERGWFWVIPFNNGPRSQNPLVSVGLTFDERVYPKPDDMTPEEEFRHHAARYPVVSRVFADAKTVRPWVSTGRLQYSSTETTGHRWCLMSHAAGFIDPLYSRGLTNTTEVINALAWRLLAAIDDDDFSAERFRYVDDLQKGLVEYNDDLVNCSFIGFSDYELWNAVFRVWAAGELPLNLRAERFMERFRESGDDEVFREMENVRHPGRPLPDQAEYHQLFHRMVELCEAVDRGERAGADAGRELMDRIEESPAIMRGIGLTERGQRFIHPGPPEFLAMGRWLATEAPPGMRYLAKPAVRT